MIGIFLRSANDAVVSRATEAEFTGFSIPTAYVRYAVLVPDRDSGCGPGRICGVQPSSEHEGDWTVPNQSWRADQCHGRGVCTDRLATGIRVSEIAFSQGWGLYSSMWEENL